MRFWVNAVLVIPLFGVCTLEAGNIYRSEQTLTFFQEKPQYMQIWMFTYSLQQMKGALCNNIMEINKALLLF